jgi:hypothetical protein
MFSLNPTYDITNIGKNIKRSKVTTGLIFKYENSANAYGHIYLNNVGADADFLVYSLKFKGWANSHASTADGEHSMPTTLTCTPCSSDKFNSCYVDIKGYFHFNVTMLDNPRVCMLNELIPYDNKVIQDVITVRGVKHTEENVNPLFLVLGYDSDTQNVNKAPTITCLRLSGDIDTIGIIHKFPASSVVAHRGSASVIAKVGV